MPSDDQVDDDGYTSFDTSPDDQDTTDQCPHCGASVYDGAEQCPACGMYLSQEDAPTRRPPIWIVIGVAICVLIVIAWIIGAIW
jgi:uncharacterized protein (DUF983 family)